MSILSEHIDISDIVINYKEIQFVFYNIKFIAETPTYSNWNSRKPYPYTIRFEKEKKSKKHENGHTEDNRNVTVTNR